MLGLVQRPDVFKVKVFYQSFANSVPAVTTYPFVSQGKKFASQKTFLFSVSINSYFAVVVLLMHYDIFVTG